ncbi:DUF2357 domain-containing protein [Brevibacillus sp. SYP-B805]|uniref:DUF2357 domain-containing protein n=1 Tax=Brevibacillus sp. SYP-B805 TaxID=1578199 RepID=UPI0013EB52D8|nr:DUF2357 domain-containing protein [Brevibacillus sp. SYP-B805]NGQ97508.1 DUF2357 domain-containing protein [Brevibacillus sp. SYP-B805]
MDLQSNLPFQLWFLFNQEKYNFSVQTFYTEIKGEEFDRPVFELLENIPVKILFNSPYKNSRLYMYGLDAVIEDRVDIDEDGEIYLRPSSEEVTLYDINYYPFIPAPYLLRVVVEEKTYYAPFLIKSKQVSFEQLELMKKELEEVMKGLAYDLIRRVYAASPEEQQVVLPPPLLKKFMALNKHYPYVMAALTDLYEKINFRIQKGYRWIREEQATTLDQISIRSVFGQTKNPGFIKAPHREVNYNLPENQWIKGIIRNVLTVLDDFINMMAAHRVQVQKEMEELSHFKHQESNRRMYLEKENELATITEYNDRVNQMRRGFQMIANAPWYQEVDIKSLSHIPHVLTTDSRYRALYQLHRDLNDEQIEIAMHPVYTFQWKRTEKLYEMWGFIKILKVLKDSFHFQPRTGWIYSRNSFGENYIIPNLPAGERIELTNDEWRLNLVYDGQLPLSASQTSEREIPLSMGKNNRPDTRIDFYRNDTYAGSLLIDFKYRPIRNFWVHSTRDSLGRKKEMDQLIAYVRDSRSDFLYGEKGKVIRQFDPRPVIEAWAIYAEVKENQRTSHYIEEDRIKIIPFNPGDDLSIITDNFEEVFQKVRDKFDLVFND